jgi:NAD(P)-dependent dehydrogenase (short-subunit alcohol dehydrogenase family)
VTASAGPNARPLDGRVVVVTGAASGIGRASACSSPSTARASSRRPLGRGRRHGRPHPKERRVALFLAFDEASYGNGQAIAVDGGLSSSLPVVRKG